MIEAGRCAGAKSISFCPGGCGPAGPDGAVFPSFSCGPVDGIFGISGTKGRGLMGVFLTTAEPVNPPPPNLNLTDYGFAQLAPRIAQQFFVGDGLKGTEIGF